jgi:hypothetical protein
MNDMSRATQQVKWSLGLLGTAAALTLPAGAQAEVTEPEPVTAEPAISRARLASNCVRRSPSGRVRVPMTVRLANPGSVQVEIARAVRSRGRTSCPRFTRTRVRETRFSPVATVSRSPGRAVAAVEHRMMLDLRLRPGLYRITFRARLETGRMSPPVHRYLRVLR